MKWTKLGSRSRSSEISEETQAQIRDFLAIDYANRVADLEEPPLYSPAEPPVALRVQRPCIQNAVAESRESHSSTHPPLLPTVKQDDFAMISLDGDVGLHSNIPGSRASLAMQSFLRQFPANDNLEHNDGGNTSLLKEQLDTLFAPFLDTLKPVEDVPPDDWLRAAAWWGLKGKEELESLSFSNGLADDSSSSLKTTQAAVDLAKAWWICNRITLDLDYLDSDENTPSYTLLEQRRSIQKYLNVFGRYLCNLFNTKYEQLSVMNDIDKSLWVVYPSCTAADSEVLRYSQTAGAADSTIPPVAFGDTDSIFSYGSEFVEVTLLTEEENDPWHSFKCVLSFVRSRSSWEIVAVLASQTDSVYIEIHSSRKKGVSWQNVHWDATRLLMEIEIQPTYIIQVQLGEQNFKMIWEISHQVTKTESLLVAGKHEDLIFEDTVGFCHYISHDRPSSFPSSPIEQCNVRLFERFGMVKEGMIERRVHRGFRFFVTTPQHTKTISKASHLFPSSSPLQLGIFESSNGFPGFLLQLLDGSNRLTVSLTFYDHQTRSLVHSLLSGAVSRPHETEIQQLPIRSLAISEPPDRDSDTQDVRYLEIGESLISVIEEKGGLERNPYGNTVWSEILRVIIETKWGSMTDRINLGLSFVRLGSSHFAHDVIGPSQLMIGLPVLDHLHKFQEAVTGYTVRCDQVASRFIINRPRRLIPISRKWEAKFTRIQLVQQNGKFQLIAFFYQSALGNCMNFEIKCTDDFRPVEKNDEWGVLIKDAKFSLPEIKPHLPGFVCLNELFYPLEHDDITIMFGEREARDELLGCLPGYNGETS
ncbi:hypothetical protein BBP40_010082 [Aspergillus hancockii]|nr:hypothetical protein BBP40_010082 [Aspergillus hancockii]